jgi:hypothetical protein
LYNGFAQEIFFGRLPSAKTEAMGRILTLNFDPYFVSQSNPASLVSSEGIALFYSNGSPFYGYTKASYNYAGISYAHPVYGGIAFNFLSFNSGSEAFGLPYQNQFVENKYLYTLTLAYTIKKWFSLGVNANLFEADFGTGKSYRDSFFELGLSRDFNIVQNSELKDDLALGTQIKNIFNQSFSAIDEAQADAFPSIFRIGLSNTIEYTDTDIYENAYFLGFTLGFEYQDLLNSDNLTAYKIGGELSLFDMIFLRGGYFSESEGKLTDCTYGLGLKLDFDIYIEDDFPLLLLIDFVSLEQPVYGSAPINWGSFNTFSLIANYKLD